jgi:predicted lipoprotein
MILVLIINVAWYQGTTMEAPVRLRTVAAAALMAATMGLGAAGCKDSGNGSGQNGSGGAGGTPGPVADGSTGSGGAGGAGSAPISRADVVKSLAACTLSVYRSFLPVAEELAATTEALATEGTAARWTAARTAWQRAMERWQEAEQFQYGPLGSESTPGGKGLRDDIYSWPFAGRCAVDQELVAQGYKNAAFPTTSLINARGLAAAEYLLFHEGTDNGCAPTVPINAGPWMALASTPDELARRKREYAAVLGADLLVRARELVDDWDPAKGNFLAQVQTAGTGSTVYPSAQAALNAQSDALFYIEMPIKDLKLAKPLGIKECASATCPQDLESRFALRSKNHIQRNIDGFEKLFAGCGDGGGVLGFDDLLIASNAAEVATGVAQRLIAIRASMQALPGEDFAAPLASTPAQVRAVYDAFKSMTDLLRSQFISVLNLQLPKDIQTDND